MSQQSLPDKKKLQWMCRRGLLELDILLNNILCHTYDHLTDEQKHYFIEILSESDNDLLAWLLHQNALPESWPKQKQVAINLIR